MTRYLIFLAGLIITESVLLWGLETAVRILILDDDLAEMYRWAIRVLSIEIAHYATCAFVFWDFRVVYPMLIPVLTLVVMLTVKFHKEGKNKKKVYGEGYPEIPDMLVRIREDDGGRIMTVKRLGEQPFMFMNDNREKTFFISPEPDPLFHNEKRISEWDSDDPAIGRLIPLREGTEYALLLDGTELSGSLTVSVFDDIGITEISYLGKTLFEIRTKEEGNYDVYCLMKGDPVWLKLMQF